MIDLKAPPGSEYPVGFSRARDTVPSCPLMPVLASWRKKMSQRCCPEMQQRPRMLCPGGCWAPNPCEVALQLSYFPGEEPETQHCCCSWMRALETFPAPTPTCYVLLPIFLKSPVCCQVPTMPKKNWRAGGLGSVPLISGFTSLLLAEFTRPLQMVILCPRWRRGEKHTSLPSTLPGFAPLPASPLPRLPW